MERLRRAHQRANIIHRANIHLTARQEGGGPGQVNGKAALDPAKDNTGYALLCLKGIFQNDPDFLAAGFLTAENRLALAIFHPLNIDFHLVAHGDFRVLPGGGKFLDRHAALGFQPDIDGYEIIIHGNDRATHHASLD